MNPLEVFGGVETPKGASLRETLRLTNRSAISAELCLLGTVTRNEQKKWKKLINTKLICLPFVYGSGLFDQL
jgi:hypothetical protein